MEQYSGIYCSNCGTSIIENDDKLQCGSDRIPCSICGSSNRIIKVFCQDSISPYDDVAMVGTEKKDTGGKKVVFKGKYGTELHHDSNTLQTRERTFDFRTNSYYEKIQNDSTNYFKEEISLITSHRGHGSAKKNKDN